MSISDVEVFPVEVLEARAQINRQLDIYTRFDSQTLSGGQCPKRLQEAIRHSLLSDGKRLRPLLVMAATHVCGGDMGKALGAACAVEMIHTYSLIHDDLPAMDDDDLRRGKPTCHVRFDEATAILAGDALLANAFEIMARDTPQGVAAECCRMLATAAGPSHLVGGQVDDLACQFGASDLETLQSIHDRKTGALLSVSLQLGGLIAGGSPKMLSGLHEYGKNVGLAFQIIDDLLDLRGEVNQIGKRTGKDSEHGKLTYPSVIGVEASEQLAREKVASAISALQIFGSNGAPLVLFANFVVDRTR
ncbi:MAG: polyprenyl synthetase family protein [Mariniblastus sp.]|nr:polyprenyl synthetase family protein [Mariniblastus sp.]